MDCAQRENDLPSPQVKKNMLFIRLTFGEDHEKFHISGLSVWSSPCRLPHAGSGAGVVAQRPAPRRRLTEGKILQLWTDLPHAWRKYQTSTTGWREIQAVTVPLLKEASAHVGRSVFKIAVIAYIARHPTPARAKPARAGGPAIAVIGKPKSS